jgi:hypothetical protein
MFTCSSVEKVYCPNVVEIENNNSAGGFDTCSQLNVIYFPLLRIVGNSGFKNCTSITSIDLPNLV